MRERYVAAIDQGTASSRCLVFDRSGRIVSVAQKEHRHIYPRPGWVEHDPEEIWGNVEDVVRTALAEARLEASDLVALGHRQPARDDDRVGSRDRPAGAQRDQLAGHPHRPPGPRALGASTATHGFRERSGLPPATYFSGPKLRWLLDTVARPARARRGGRGAVRDDGLVADLAADRPPPHRRHQRQPDDADEPAHARLGRRAARRARRAARRCCPRSGPRPRSTARRRRPARGGAGGRGARRPAGRPVRPDLLLARRGQVHLRDRQLPPAQHGRAPGRLRQRAADHAVLSRRRRAADLRAGGIDRGDRRARAVVSRQPRR